MDEQQGTGGLAGMARPLAHAGGSDAPEQAVVSAGFLPLTDCASLVVAAREGFDRRHGIRIRLVRQPSWAALRDRLLDGSLDVAQMLYPLVYGVHLGLGSPQRDMALLMALSANGQAITLSSRLAAAGVRDGAAFAAWVKDAAQPPLLASTHAIGTHTLWLNYWLAAHGVDPLHAVQTTTIAPPRMHAHLAAGEIEGFCAGEPWNAVAAAHGTGFTVATSQQVWPGHPEKVLGATARFAQANPNTCRALLMALLEASRHLDRAPGRAAAARALAEPGCLDLPEALIAGRLQGCYDDGLGRRWLDPHPVQFHGEGAVNFPWLSDGLWFLGQLRRWDLLTGPDTDQAVVRAVHRLDAYREAAAALGVPVPQQPTRRVTLFDGAVWDGAAAAPEA